jgi:hypothetical protein
MGRFVWLTQRDGQGGAGALNTGVPAFSTARKSSCQLFGNPECLKNGAQGRATIPPYPMYPEPIKTPLRAFVGLWRGHSAAVASTSLTSGNNFTFGNCCFERSVSRFLV